MKFLEYRGNHIGVKQDLLHDLPVTELVRLRDSITAFRNILKIWEKHLVEELTLFIDNPDFSTLRLNKGMIPEILETLNGAIARRNTAKRQKEQTEAMEKP